MRYGCCVNMIARDPYGIGFDWIPELGALGFDYIDLPMAQMMALDDGDFRKLVAEPLQASGLPCACVNNLFPAGIRLTGPDADPVEAMRYARRAFARAAELGATKAVFGSSGARNVPLRWLMGDAAEQLSQLLSMLAVPAEENGITLVLEPLNRGESNILTSIAECVRLCKDLDEDNVQMLADYYHMALSGEGPMDLFVTTARLRHVHIARPLGRLVPDPGDNEDYWAFFSMLKRIGYDEDISIEAYAPEDTAETMKKGVAYLRMIEKTGRA